MGPEYYHFGRARRIPWDIGVPRFPMRIDPDLRRCVAFIGFKDGDGIRPIGTCFFITYDGAQYLVTAQHVAVGIGDSPFCVRVNRHDGESVSELIDPLTDERTWLSKDNVDIAARLYAVDEEFVKTSSALSLPPSMIIGEPGRARYVDVGDMTYTIGLFRLVAGKKRNVPVVHCGNIALLAGEEPITVHDWLTPNDSRKTRSIDAHLIEQQSLQGLSGAPVFVRPPAFVGPLQLAETNQKYNGMIPTIFTMLLGVWQGAWDAKPDEILAADRGGNMRVPVGMGVVSPVADLVEILEMPKAKAEREAFKKENPEPDNLPKADAIFVEAREAANPRHKEDFTALLNAAVRKPK